MSLGYELVPVNAYVELAVTLLVAAITAAAVSMLLRRFLGEISPDVSRVEKQLQVLREQHLDLLDKVEHWVRRDRIRRLREANEQEAPEAPAPDLSSPAERKQALRSRLALMKRNGG